MDHQPCDRPGKHRDSVQQYAAAGRFLSFQTWGLCLDYQPYKSLVYRFYVDPWPPQAVTPLRMRCSAAWATGTLTRRPYGSWCESAFAVRLAVQIRQLALRMATQGRQSRRQDTSAMETAKGHMHMPPARFLSLQLQQICGNGVYYQVP